MRCRQYGGDAERAEHTPDEGAGLDAEDNAPGAPAAARGGGAQCDFLPEIGQECSCSVHGVTYAMGTVERIWRYPIKSTGGEQLRRADVDTRGLVGDRLFAVRDGTGKLGSGKNTRRFRRMPGLLQLRSRYADGTQEPELLDPHGAIVADPTAYLRRYLGRDDVALAREQEISHFDQLPLSVLTTATLDWARGGSRCSGRRAALPAESPGADPTGYPSVRRGRVVRVQGVDRRCPVSGVRALQRAVCHDQ